MRSLKIHSNLRGEERGAKPYSPPKLKGRIKA